MKPSLKLIQYPNQILTQPCSELDEVDWELKKTFKDMHRLLKKKEGWAIAANQVGIPLRFFVFDFGTGMQVAINPEIEQILSFPGDEAPSNDFVYREGCLSLPGRFWYITRPNMVKVSYWDQREDYIEGVVMEVEGRVFQHEIDHLDGHIILERLDEEQRRKVLEDIRDETQQPIAPPQFPLVHPYARDQAPQKPQR